MLYKNYPYTANFEEYIPSAFAESLDNLEVIGHIRFQYQSDTIYELIYLHSSTNQQDLQYYKVEWYQADSNVDSGINDQYSMDSIFASDMDEDEAYYTIVYDIKEICTEFSEIDELLFMHDTINMRALMWDCICGLYRMVFWIQDNLTRIPNYVSGFIRNLCPDDQKYCVGTADRIPLLSAMIYSHGVYAVSNLLDITPNKSCLLGINDPLSPLFAFWHMLDGNIFKKIWMIFDIVDIYYDENYRILQYGPTCNGYNLIQQILHENNSQKIRDYIEEIRDPDWLEYCNKCDSVIFTVMPAIYNRNMNCYYKLCYDCSETLGNDSR